MIKKPVLTGNLSMMVDCEVFVIAAQATTGADGLAAPLYGAVCGKSHSGPLP